MIILIRKDFSSLRPEDLKKEINTLLGRVL
jgi:hypothetical protein